MNFRRGCSHNFIFQTFLFAFRWKRVYSFLSYIFILSWVFVVKFAFCISRSNIVMTIKLFLDSCSPFPCCSVAFECSILSFSSTISDSLQNQHSPRGQSAPIWQLEEGSVSCLTKKSDKNNSSQSWFVRRTNRQKWRTRGYKLDSSPSNLWHVTS